MAKVLHVRDQIQTGLSLADAFMERHCLMVCTDKGQKDSLTGMLRRLQQDANKRFEAVDLDKTHHIGYCDVAKLGRLAQPEIDALAY